MSFEVRAKDLAGRVGRLHTRGGVVETPALFPVVDPRRQEVPAGTIAKYFGQVITNSYFIYSTYSSPIDAKRLIGWGGVLMTDSGAYQAMRYGTVDVDPDQIVAYQAAIGSDIGVILDLPFDYEEPYATAALKVEETIRRARRALRLRDRLDGMLLVAPIQGGLYADLLVRSARALTSMDFDIYAIGSPTTLLEEYMFDRVLEVVALARSSMRREAPVHLFGAGHPLILPFAVALGVDLFDSASYVLYARDGRIMLRDRTIKLEDVATDYLPCSTRLCYIHVKELKEMEPAERAPLIAEHNLAVLREELLEIRQRIHEGTLWEYLEEKARAHPALYRSLKLMRRFLPLLEEMDPATHPTPHGLTLYGDTAGSRPEPHRHWARLREYSPPAPRAVVVRASSKPYTRSLERPDGQDHVVFYDPIFGPVPEEVAEVYPLAQNESEGELEEARARLYESVGAYEDVRWSGVDLGPVRRRSDV